MFWEEADHRRYKQVSDLVTSILTIESQKRLDATMQDGYSKAIAAGATQQELTIASAAMGEKAHAFASAENAKRIRQWTEAILAAESSWMSAHPPVRALRWMFLGGLIGAAATIILRGE